MVMMKKFLPLLFLTSLFLGCIPEPKPEILGISFNRSDNDRVVFYLDKKNQKSFDIFKYPSQFKFNDCEKHLEERSKDSFITMLSLGNCTSDFNITKDKSSYYFLGTANFYEGEMFISFGESRSQTFNKTTIGVKTDYENYVEGLITKGEPIKEGLNTNEAFDGVKVFILKADHNYSF